MSSELQNFLSTVTAKAANDLIEAVENLPEDKWGWSPLDKGRSALDQAAECALLNGSTADVLINRTFDRNFDFEQYAVDKAELAKDWIELKALLSRNAEKVVAAIQATPDADMNVEVTFPWGPMKLEAVMAYPYWNMSYHLGQVTYIGFLAE